LSLLASATRARADSLTDSAVAWWTFEGDLSGIKNVGTGTGLTAVPVSSAPFSNPVAVDDLTFTALPAAGETGALAAANAGAKAIQLDGATALVANPPSLKITGAQTLWLRVNVANLDAAMTLIGRYRATNSARGMMLQLQTSGRLAVTISEDGTNDSGKQDYIQTPSGADNVLSVSTWYDISLRFTPAAAGVTNSGSVNIDVFNPLTGNAVNSWSYTTSLTATFTGSNAGYFYLGAQNNGTSGSNLPVPNGTLIEAAGVWNRALSNAEIASLSAAPIPEPETSVAILGALAAANTFAISRRR
jgi:hypothetical protein